MGRLLWEPSRERIERSNMYRFMRAVNDRYDQDLKDYAALYQWSIEHIPQFWAEMWDFAEIRHSRGYDQVVDDLTRMPGAEWFSGAWLNFAENLLRYRDDRTALIFKGEGRAPVRMTYAELFAEVAAVAEALRELGVTIGDRVVGFMPNMPQTTVAMLAATSLGAVWSSCSPDFGLKGVLDRFGQIRPKVLFSADGYLFKGRPFDCRERVAGLMKELPSLEKVVVVPYLEETPSLDALPSAVLYPDFKAQVSPGDMEFAEVPFGHPLYIMYSSGTTGLPKCMVQSAGGVLIHHLKELMLHTDLKREDTLLYVTTCGWMMWNWLTSALAVGATLVLYDGNPFHPEPDVLWQLAQDEKITVFGTSAGYLSALEAAGVEPKSKFDLSAVRTILSTGSPLSVEGFDYVYGKIKSDVQLASISGGTDLNGCFALGNPLDPVYAGEIQCRGLAMKVEAFDETGRPVLGRKGELVCSAPFPSMPLYFWDDPNDEKYKAAYFDVYPGVWRHGDFIEINERGGVVIYGRSDATLNPGGVRIGTAEIYRQVEQMPEVADSLVVGQPWKNDVRVILFVQMAEGQDLTDEIKARIRQTLRQNASPRHVPAKIVAVPDIPYTLNMKKVELAVRKVLMGEPVLNKDALSNPQALDAFADLPELQSD